MLRAFHERFLEAEGPPTRLQEWLQAAEDEDNMVDHDNDDQPERARPEEETRGR